MQNSLFLTLPYLHDLTKQQKHKMLFAAICKSKASIYLRTTKESSLTLYTSVSNLFFQPTQNLQALILVKSCNLMICLNTYRHVVKIFRITQYNILLKFYVVILHTYTGILLSSKSVGRTKFGTSSISRNYYVLRDSLIKIMIFESTFV